MPTMPGTSSVPLLRPPMCSPPWSKLLSGMLFFINNAPTPFGPWNLCAEKLRKSTSRSWTSIFILPTACTASVWNKAPYSWATLASSFIGKIMPVSLFALIMATSATFSSMTALSWSGVTMPSLFTSKTVRSTPYFSRNLQVAKMAGCSTAVVTMRFFSPVAILSK